jgi:starch synthase
MKADALNVLFLAVEAEPFVKIGGLADVAGSLPLALRNLSNKDRPDRKLDVRLVLPLHRVMTAESATMRQVAEFPVYRLGRNLPARVFETSMAGMPVYFISGEPISSATSVYSQDPAQDREKFTFFSLAALEMIRTMTWKPDIIHANDWHTALALYALRSRLSDPMNGRTRSMLTLHNLAYLGGDGTDELAAYGLIPPIDEALPEWARTQPLPLGLLSADAVVAVSPTYSHEILTPEFGCGLEAFLDNRSASISGILNGLDLAAWDPETDKCLNGNFSAVNLTGRSANKAALQRQLSLREDPHIPILAMIGRIDQQKGVDIIPDVLHQITDLPWQFVLLGSGDPSLENTLRELELEYPERIRSVIRFDAQMGHSIYGGADMLLMPSRYEPCGLAQMIAMRYGCVPVVHATGGLKDTVEEGKTGFLFPAAEATAMLEALRRALSTYASPGTWEKFQRNGMAKDFSWSRSAAQYAELYRSLILE